MMMHNTVQYQNSHDNSHNNANDNQRRFEREMASMRAIYIRGMVIARRVRGMGRVRSRFPRFYKAPHDGLHSLPFVRAPRRAYAGWRKKLEVANVGLRVDAPSYPLGFRGTAPNAINKIGDALENRPLGCR